MLRNLTRRRELIWQLSLREMQGKYRGSYLGMIWALVTPLLTLMVYTFVFHFVFHAHWTDQPDENFMVYAMNMFSGIIAFNVFSESTVRAPLLIVQNMNFVKKVVFPLEVLPVSVVAAAVMHSLLALVILVVGAACGAGPLHWTLVLLPIVFLPLIMFTTGICWILSSLGVFLRDLGNVVQVVVQLLFFATPVTYPLTRIGDPRIRLAMLINPLTSMVVNFHRVTNEGLPPELGSYSYSLAAGALAAIVGYAWFMKIKRAFADVI
ncbi:MAG: ABC transporter permease [Tepidisphaeraceae bacterium]|jgi:lipopolysaccharide transport system permease protein